MSVIDYLKWRQALAMTESNADPKAWGDSGQAMGQWQMHPSFVWDYGPDSVRLSDKWDDVCSQTLQNFFNEFEGGVLGPVHLAMMFHLGVTAVKNGKWDTPYADRFKSFYGSGV